MPTLYEASRDAIIATVRTVETDTQVQIHNRTRVIADWTRLLQNFVASLTGEPRDKYRGWWVTRGPDGPSAWADQAPTAQRIWNFEIRGVLGVKDADDSETVWQNLTDAVITALDAMDYPTADDRFLVGGMGPSYRRAFDVRQYGSVLCHYVEIVTPVIVLEEL